MTIIIKTVILVIVHVLLCHSAFAQNNIISNGSFEDGDRCEPSACDSDVAGDINACRNDVQDWQWLNDRVKECGYLRTDKIGRTGCHPLCLTGNWLFINGGFIETEWKTFPLHTHYDIFKSQYVYDEILTTPFQDDFAVWRNSNSPPNYKNFGIYQKFDTKITETSLVDVNFNYVNVEWSTTVAEFNQPRFIAGFAKDEHLSGNMEIGRWVMPDYTDSAYRRIWQPASIHGCACGTKKTKLDHFYLDSDCPITHSNGQALQWCDQFALDNVSVNVTPVCDLSCTRIKSWSDPKIFTYPFFPIFTQTACSPSDPWGWDFLQGPSRVVVDIYSPSEEDVLYHLDVCDKNGNFGKFRWGGKTTDGRDFPQNQVYTVSLNFYFCHHDKPKTYAANITLLPTSLPTAWAGYDHSLEGWSFYNSACCMGEITVSDQVLVGGNNSFPGPLEFIARSHVIIRNVTLAPDARVLFEAPVIDFYSGDLSSTNGAAADLYIHDCTNKREPEPEGYVDCSNFEDGDGLDLSDSTDRAIWRKREIEQPKRLSMTAKPNPFSDGTTLTILSSATEAADFTVYDAMGNQVMSFTQNLAVGPNEYPLSSSELSSGIYTVVIRTTSGKQVSVKIIKGER